MAMVVGGSAPAAPLPVIRSELDRSADNICRCAGGIGRGVLRGGGGEVCLVRLGTKAFVGGGVFQAGLDPHVVGGPRGVSCGVGDQT